jgi:hypothetical protein
LVQSKQPPSLANVSAGLRGMKAPRLLDAGNSLWLIAADAPLSLYGKSPIETGLQDVKWVAACAVAHEEVIEHFMRSGTVIPMKLFTLFSTDERALLHIKKTRKMLDAAIELIAGCKEWGVRISFNAARAARAARAETKPLAGKGATGTQFLLLKKKERDLAREWKERASAEAKRAYRDLAKYAEDARSIPTEQGEAGGMVILDSAFLIASGKVKRFREAIERLTARIGQTYDVTLTGPWPPYNFVMKAK